MDQTTFHILYDILTDVLGECAFHHEHRHQLGFDCPMCSDEKNMPDGDDKANLEVNYLYGVFKCWACEEHNNMYGSVYKLIRNFGTNQHLKDFKLLDVEFERYENGDYYVDLWEDDESYEITVDLPREFTPLMSLGSTVRNEFINGLYKERGLTENIIQTHNIGFCFSGKYKDRYIIPSYNINGNVNYFVARSNDNREDFKYLNCGIPKQKIIFNEYFINWSKTIFLVEGVFDHLVLPNSIPLLGTKLSELIWGRLYEKAENKVIIALDGEAYGQAVRIYNDLNGGKLAGRVCIANFGLFDPCEYYVRYGYDGMKKVFQKCLIP